MYVKSQPLDGHTCAHLNATARKPDIRPYALRTCAIPSVSPALSTLGVRSGKPSTERELERMDTLAAISWKETGGIGARMVILSEIKRCEG